MCAFGSEICLPIVAPRLAGVAAPPKRRLAPLGRGFSRSPRRTDSKHVHPATILLHGGQVSDPTTGARTVSISKTTSYEFRDSDHATKLFALEEFGNIYRRLMKPTTDVRKSVCWHSHSQRPELHGRRWDTSSYSLCRAQHPAIQLDPSSSCGHAVELR